MLSNIGSMAWASQFFVGGWNGFDDSHNKALVSPEVELSTDAQGRIGEDDARHGLK